VVKELASSELKLVGFAAVRQPWEEDTPAYSFHLEHQYRDPGSYNVTMTISNPVSSLTRHAAVLVEEAIGEITVSTDVPGVVKDNTQWTFKAVVKYGRNLKFEWHFGDSFAGPALDPADVK
jgi:hypothetical protein